METVITNDPDPGQLRAAMVDSLTAGGRLRTPEIISAFTEPVPSRRRPPGRVRQAAACS